jgi:hypothetical protein
VTIITIARGMLLFCTSFDGAHKGISRSLLLRVCGSCSLPPLTDDAGDVVEKVCILEYNHKKPNIVSARLEGNSM